MTSEEKYNGALQCHIYHALPDSSTLKFHKIFRLIFLKQLSCPKTMYAEHWRKLAWATFLGNFLILLVHISVEHL